jgi:hypothetical protein
MAVEHGGDLARTRRRDRRRGRNQPTRWQWSRAPTRQLRDPDAHSAPGQRASYRNRVRLSGHARACRRPLGCRHSSLDWLLASSPISSERPESTSPPASTNRWPAPSCPIPAALGSDRPQRRPSPPPVLTVCQPETLARAQRPTQRLIPKCSDRLDAQGCDWSLIGPSSGEIQAPQQAHPKHQSPGSPRALQPPAATRWTPTRSNSLLAGSAVFRSVGRQSERTDSKADMSARIYRLPAARPVLLTKKQLAAHLGRSTRWIELQMRRGLPVEIATDRFGARRYDLAKVEAWLRAGEPVSRRQGTLSERVAALELLVGELAGGAR